MTSVLDSIENSGIVLEQTKYYAAILGESPSRGARSPLLWNAAFKQLGISGIMHPMDIVPNNLEVAVQCLRDDNRFIGGAVTMPYKVDIIPYLDFVDPLAEKIGAVNCLFRERDKLAGTNTDGAGALWSLQRVTDEPLAGKTVVLVGAGGAGYAVAVFVASALGERGTLRVANRTPDSAAKLVGKLHDTVQTEALQQWPPSESQLADADALINCSSIGFAAMRNDAAGSFCLQWYTPLGPIDETIRVAEAVGAEKMYARAAAETVAVNHEHSLKVLSAMNAPVVFDIIYQPSTTMLLSLAGAMGYRTINGLPMNLEQAVIAFDKATSSAGLRNSDVDAVRNILSAL